jgi:hypothetical protein
LDVMLRGLFGGMTKIVILNPEMRTTGER